MEYLDEMSVKFQISRMAVIATGAVTALTVAGLLKVKKESLRRCVTEKQASEYYLF
jgi:hypothetical protein